jgi:hypothetical protein
MQIANAKRDKSGSKTALKIGGPGCDFPDLRSSLSKNQDYFFKLRKQKWDIQKRALGLHSL